MSMNIKNEETHQLAREVMELTGETQTAAVTNALRERLNRLRCARRTSLADDLRAISQDIAQGIAEPYWSTDHGDVLYDENGMPK